MVDLTREPAVGARPDGWIGLASLDPTRRHRRIRAAVAVLAVAAGTAAALLVSRSEHENAPGPTAFFVLLTGWSFVGAGLVAWSRRPGNAVGPMMVAVGFLSLVGSLGEANGSVPFTVGVALGNLSIAAFAHLLLMFPGGRLETRLQRAVAAGLYLTLVGLQVLWVLFADFRETGCEDCVAGGVHEPARLAENAFLVRADESVAALVDGVQNALGIGLALAVTGILVRRWRTASRPARQALAPVLVAGVAALVLFLVVLASFLVWDDPAAYVEWVAYSAYASVPFAFLLGLMRSRLARSAVGSLVVQLGDAPSAVGLRDLLAGALRDPSLELAYRYGNGTFVDREGRPVELPAPGGDRVATMIARAGEPVAALVHDVSVLDDAHLVDAVTAAAGLALENERLHAELRARLGDLERQRDFLATVADTTPSLLAVIDPEGRIVRVNRAVERAAGVEDGPGIRGRYLWDVLVGDEDREAVRGLVTRDSAGSEHEHRWRGRAGRTLLVAWTSTPLRDEAGQPRFLVCGVDVTERARQAEELRRSRARIVEAGDAERRRLERNLHDGAQQRLVSMSVALRLAETRLASDPAAAQRLLSTAIGELTEAVGELRELARGIHPAVLTEGGLGAALELLARRSPVPVGVAPLPAERLPEQVEAAAYYVVAEALTNVGRYAHATRATVEIAREHGLAVVRVADDGVGGADPGRGTGLRGLRDRVEALSGRLRVESSPGRGTAVVAEIPCA